MEAPVSKNIMAWPSALITNNSNEPKESLACTVRGILDSENVPVYGKEYSVAKDLNMTFSLMEILLFNSDFAIEENFPPALGKRITGFI